MRHLLLAALASLFTATAAPAFAASIFDVLFSGTVASDVTSGPPLPIVFGQNLTGKPVHVSESFNLANAIFTEFPNSYFGGSNFVSAELTIGNVSAPFQDQGGSFSLGLGGFSTGVFTKGPGVDETALNFSNTFNTIQNGFVTDGSLFLLTGPSIRNIDFNIASETLVLPPVLSPVPLPPALPLFAFALLALGIVGYVGRKREPPSMVFGSRRGGASWSNAVGSTNASMHPMCGSIVGCSTLPHTFH
jgi:hypothetical protein